MKQHTHHANAHHQQHQEHGRHGLHHQHEEGHPGQEESERHQSEPHHGRGGHRGEGFGRGHFGGPQRFGGPRGRARRGEARYILLDALRGGPKHGYEIIKSLEDRSGGQYAPSPGTVYPTMQLLEDLGLVRADQSSDRRVFHLTEAGLADLETHTQEIADFWARFAADPSATKPEAGFLRDEMESLFRTVREGLHGPLSTGDTEVIRTVRLALERCRNEIREIVTQSAKR